MSYLIDLLTINRKLDISSTPEHQRSMSVNVMAYQIIVGNGVLLQCIENRTLSVTVV